MSLGALAFLVGSQIGKTQKNTYERNLEEEKKKEQRAIKAQKEQELRQFDLNILEAEEKARIDVAKQKEIGIFEVTTKKNEELANKLVNYSMEDTLKMLEGLTKDEVEIQSILNLRKTKLDEKRVFGELENKLKLEYDGDFSSILKGRKEDAAKIDVDKEKKLIKARASSQRVEDIYRYSPEFLNATMDGKLEIIKKEGIAKNEVQLLAKLAEVNSDELNNKLNERSADKITSDTAAQGEADTLAMIANLSNDELAALKLYSSSQKILSDSEATTTAKLRGLKRELNDKEYQRLLLSAKRNERTQEITIEFEGELMKLTNDDYQALLNSRNSEKILAEAAARDQAMIITLGNKELQDSLATSKTADQLRAGDAEIIVEMKKLGNNKLQYLLRKAKVDDARALGIINNVLAINLEKDKLTLKNEDADISKNIALTKNTSSILKVQLPPDDINEEGRVLKIPIYTNYANEGVVGYSPKDQRDRIAAPMQYLSNFTASQDFADLMTYGSLEDQQTMLMEIYNQTRTFIQSTQDYAPNATTSRVVLDEYKGFLQHKAAQDTVQKAQDDEGIQSIKDYTVNNDISEDELIKVRYVAPDRVTDEFRLEPKEIVKTFNDLQSFRISGGYTTQKKLDAGEDIQFYDRKILTFYNEFMKPDASRTNGYTFSDFINIGSYLDEDGDIERVPVATRKNILRSGRAAGFTNAEQYITAIGIAVGKGVKSGKSLTYEGRQNKLKAFGVDIEDVNAKNSSSTGLIRTIRSIASTYPEKELAPFRREAQAAELLEGITADPDATALGGMPLASISFISSKLPNAVQNVLKFYGFDFEKIYENPNADPTIRSSGGDESGFFEGYGRALGNGAMAGYGTISLAEDRDRIEADLQRHKNTGSKVVTQLAGRLGKTVNDITVEDYYEAEVAARRRTVDKYNEARMIYESNGNNASGISRIEAKRDLLKFVVAYQYASLLQGGTGGRTISDQDVENMLQAMKQGDFSDPQGALSASIEILKQASLQNEITASYLSGDNSQIAGAYFFERELSPKVNFMYTDSTTARNKIGDTTGNFNASATQLDGQAFKLVDGFVQSTTETTVGKTKATRKPTAESIRNDYAAGKEIVITEPLLQLLPELKGKFSVGQKIKKGGDI